MILSINLSTILQHVHFVKVNMYYHPILKLEVADNSVFAPKRYFKPFNYPEAYDGFTIQNKIHWIKEEVPVANDIRDWNSKMTDNEKHFITQILRFFTTSDVDVGQVYINTYLQVFHNEEVRMMLSSFANMEGIHADAYSTILDTLGLPETEYQAFKKYEVMLAKHEFIDDYMLTPNDVGLDAIRKIIKILCINTLLIEGMQLYSSFAMLLSFPRKGLLKNVGQYIAFSIRDESHHVDKNMSVLFKNVVKEFPMCWTDDIKNEVREIANKMVKLEDLFIELAFDLKGLDNISISDTKTYIRYIADMRLKSIGLQPVFNVNVNPFTWVDEIAGTREYVNFFENRPMDYSKISLTGSWDDVWGQYK